MIILSDDTVPFNKAAAANKVSPSTLRGEILATSSSKGSVSTPFIAKKNKTNAEMAASIESNKRFMADLTKRAGVYRVNYQNMQERIKTIYRDLAEKRAQYKGKKKAVAPAGSAN